MSATVPPILLFSSVQTGNTPVTTADGSFVAAVEQMITTGVAAPVVTKMSVANERVVCELAASSKVVAGSKIKIEGAAIAELNGYFMIEGTFSAGTRFYFTVPGLADTATVGGTIIYSYPKPNWEVVAKRTNELVIRSSVASLSRIYYYFQETTSYTGNRSMVAVRGLGYFNSWTDFDTNSMPNRLSTALVADDYLIIKCQYNPTQPNCWWMMAFTDKTFHYMAAGIEASVQVQDIPPNTAGVTSFLGEHKSYIRNDEGAGMIMAEATVIPNNNTSSLPNQSSAVFRYNTGAAAVNISRFRNAAGLQSKVVYANITTANDEVTSTYSGDSTNKRKGYNPFTGELEIAKIRLMDTDNSAFIGELPGVYVVLADISSVTRPYALMPGTGEMAGRTFMTVPISTSTYTFSNNSNKGMFLLDLTGPWS